MTQFPSYPKRIHIKATIENHTTNAAENNAIHDVRTAGLNLNYALEQLDLTAKYYENASHALELVDARYKLGSSSIVELSQAQLNATQADIAHTSAKYDCAIQRAILNFQIGAER